MKIKILFFACSIFLMPSLLNAQKWTKVKSKEGKFELEFPQEPELEVSEKESSDSYQYTLTHNDMIYMASAVVHQAPLTGKGLSGEALAEASLEAFSGVMGGTISDKDNFNIGKSIGKSCKIENKDKGFICFYKCIIVGQIQYQFIIMNTASAEDKKSREKYFNSIKIK